MDFLHHEVLISTLFCCLSIPVNSCKFFLDFITIKIIECSLATFKACHLQVPDIIYISCIFKDSRYIRCNICLIPIDTNNHRAVLTRNPDFTWILFKHYCKCIRTTYTNHSLSKRINWSNIVFLVIIIY